MLHRKNADDQPSAEEQALHQRVYDMMELDRSKQAEAAKMAEPVAPVPAPAAPMIEAPLDIFKDLKTDPPIAEIKAVAVPVDSELPEENPEATPTELVDIYDEAIDKVVDEIVVAEGDDLLAAEDLAAQLKTLPPKKKSKSKLGHLFKK